MDGDDMFAAESKYAALTALVAFLKDKDWMRQVEAEFARAGEVLSEEGEEEGRRRGGADGGLRHGLFERFLAFQVLVEARIADFLEEHDDGELTKESLFEQLAQASQSEDRYSAAGVQALITRCTDFGEFLKAVRAFRQEEEAARKAATDMGF